MIVPFRGRSSAFHPINTVKHIIDSEGVVTSVNSRNVIALGVPQVSTTFDPSEVRQGAKINGFFLSIFMLGASGQPVVGTGNWYLIKLHTAQTGPPNAGGTGSSSLRNQIIHEEKGVLASGDGTAMAFKGVIAVPRGMRRMRQGDSWEVILRMSGADDANFCVKAIYKEIF